MRLSTHQHNKLAQSNPIQFGISHRSTLLIDFEIDMVFRDKEEDPRLAEQITSSNVTHIYGHGAFVKINMILSISNPVYFIHFMV